MPRDVLKLSIAHEDGASPTALNMGGVPGASGVCVLSACFVRALHIGATNRRPHLAA